LVDREILIKGVRPYSHLAIHPCPEEFIRDARLSDGSPVVLRPIRPEDVPLWYRPLKTFSKRTIRFRYFAPGKKINHEMAVRNCFVDCEKEMAIVAEITQEDRKELIGIGHLFIFPDLQKADLAVVVGNPW